MSSTRLLDRLMPVSPCLPSEHSKLMRCPSMDGSQGLAPPQVRVISSSPSWTITFCRYQVPYCPGPLFCGHTFITFASKRGIISWLPIMLISVSVSVLIFFLPIFGLILDPGPTEDALRICFLLVLPVNVLHAEIAGNVRLLLCFHLGFNPVC